MESDKNIKLLGQKTKHEEREEESSLMRERERERVAENVELMGLRKRVSFFEKEEETSDGEVAGIPMAQLL